MIYILANVLTLLLIFLFQLSFLNTLLFPLNNVLLFLAIPVFIMVMVKAKLSYFWLAIVALTMEMLSSSFPLLTILAFLGSLLIIQSLIYTVFTHKNIYSLLILTVLSVFLYFLILFLGNYIAYLFKSSISENLINFYNVFILILWASLFNCIINLLLYLFGLKIIFKKYNIFL